MFGRQGKEKYMKFESKGWSLVSTTPAINGKNSILRREVFLLCWHAFRFILRCRQADFFATVSSPVSLTPAKISPQIFVTNRNGPKRILRVPGKLIHEKKTWRRKSRVRLPSTGYFNEQHHLRNLDVPYMCMNVSIWTAINIYKKKKRQPAIN